MFKLLIVDDEQRIREVIKTYAEFEGHEVMEAKDGLEAIQLCKENDFDVIVMDIMMPHLDGFSAYKEIKKTKDIPVLMLSARDEEYDKLFGFEIGVDDYVSKPFSVKELIARMKVVMDRRFGKAEIKKYQFAGLVVDSLGRKVFVDEEVAPLTPKEIDLLLYLLEHRNVAISREQILESVWKYDYFGDNRTVDTHIKMLRHNLGNYRDHIVTVRGVGYKFEDES